MLNEPPFFFDVMRKCEVLFATIFNNIYIDRKVKQGNNYVTTQSLLIPVIRASKDKQLARVEGDPELNKEIAMQLPMMSFEQIGMRKRSGDQKFQLNKTVALDPKNKSRMQRQFQAVPYDFHYQLYIYVKEEEDANKIVEQIVPFFQPDWTPTVKLVPELGHTVDIPIILNSIDKQDNYEGKFNERKVLVWILDFTMKTYLYGPVKSKPIIKFADTNIRAGTPEDTTDGAEVTLHFRVQPGMDANGYPTSDESRSIDPRDISATDNYGYVIK